jgi:hypothetical protein
MDDILPFADSEEEMLQSLHRLFTLRFEGMRALVKQFIEFCPCCQKMSRIAPAIQATPFTMATYRFGERVDIDTIRPLPKYDYDNEYVVVIVDAFSRFVKLTPVKSTSRLNAARALIDFVGTFACPRIIHSDRAQFLNDMITSLVTEGFAAFQRVTTAASKADNAIVERANKEVNRHLRAFVFDIASSVRWSFGLSMIQRIVNTTVHSGIGIAPAQLVFASHADLDRGILFERATPDEQFAYDPPARMNAFVSELFRIQAQVLGTALAVQLAQDAQNLATRQAVQIADPVEIREGDYVLLEYSDLGLGALVVRGHSKLRNA